MGPGWPGVVGVSGRLNGAAFRLLSQARYRRVDLVMIGDSHQLQNGNGYDDGFGRALAQKYSLYASPLYNQEITGTAFSNRGFATTSPSTLTNSAATGADAALDAYLLPSNHAYAYQASGDMGSTNGIAALNDVDGIDVNANLRMHYAYATFNSGSGLFRPAVRLGESPFTVLQTATSINTNTGAFGQAITTMDLAAAVRNKHLEFKWRMNGGTANVGPTLQRWQRLENLDRLTGISVSTLYAVGGQSLYDAAAWILAETDAALTNYFTAIRYLQVQAGQTPYVVVYLCFGHNDRNETSTPSLGPAVVGGPSTAAAYIDNLQAVVNRVTAIWTLNGWDTAGLAFLVVPSHPDSDDAVVDTYRKAVVSWARTHPNASAIDYSKLTTYAEINGNSWFNSPPHLTLAGYETLASRAVGLLN